MPRGVPRRGANGSGKGRELLAGTPAPRSGARRETECTLPLIGGCRLLRAACGAQGAGERIHDSRRALNPILASG